MRADELDHKELLELDPESGLIRFAGQRALLLDAVAMGLLRKYLVDSPSWIEGQGRGDGYFDAGSDRALRRIYFSGQ